MNFVEDRLFLSRIQPSAVLDLLEVFDIGRVGLSKL